MRRLFFNSAGIAEIAVRVAVLMIVFSEIVSRVTAPAGEGAALMFWCGMVLAFCILVGLLVFDILPMFSVFRDWKFRLIRPGDKVICRWWITANGQPTTFEGRVEEVRKGVVQMRAKSRLLAWRLLMRPDGRAFVRVAIGGLLYKVPLAFVQITRTVKDASIRG